MAVIAPEWLTKRGGSLKLSHDGAAWLVCFDNEPQYLLRPIPASGKCACEVEQTINGKRIESGKSFATTDDAIHGGLEDMRKTLGW